MNNSKLYKKIFVDADIRDFIWRRNLELRLEVERIMNELDDVEKGNYLENALEKTLEMVVKSHGKAMRRK